MSGTSRSTLWLVTALAATGALLAAVLWLENALARAGRPDLLHTDLETIPLLATVASASTVGAVLASRRPRHPVGWLFLALGASIPAGGVLDGYGFYGAVARPGSLPGADLAAVLGDASFIVWFALLLWILHLTPTGSPLSPRWRRLAVASTVVMILCFATSLLWPFHLPAPSSAVRSPLALDERWGSPLTVARDALGAAAGVCFIAAGVSLLVRFRRSRGDERRQLLWLAVVVVPLPGFVALAFYASPDHPRLLALAVAGFMGLLPIAAGLSIARYHLYDVEQILSRALAYLLASALLAATFAVIVVTAGQVVGSRAGGSTIPAVLATLGAVAVAAPAYRGFQEALDRRFNRRRYDAVRRVQEFVRDPSPDVTIEEVLRGALTDPGLSVAYWVADRHAWVLPDGSDLDPDDEQLEVTRQGRPIARIQYDAGAVEPDVAEAACAAATAELENAMLRARISLQLAEVRDSRTRIASAHVTERRRLERNLHDGAQQRLLALALELRAAQLNGSVERLGETVTAAVDGLQTAVRELRELANGLNPAVLQDAGLAPAIEDLAARFPVEVDMLGLDGRRFPGEIEATAWFIVCEGLTNAVKHASATHIELHLSATDGALRVRVNDDGAGRADPAGGGLRGLADRAEAVGGSLTVESTTGGTTLTAELPCGS